jgi:DNA-binding CsgD family transcriptional regulator
MLLVSAENAEATDERRALRLSEIAVYGLAGGLPQEGERAIDGANAALAAVTRHTPRTERARLFLALAELLRGRTSAAQHHLTGVEQRLPPAMRRLRALAACVRAYYRSQLGNVENAELEKSLDRLEREQFGGMARLLAALPLATAGDQTFSALTSSEREILALLADGASTKDIARTTGRSPHTIDTHIRSICRKLACSGRREAVALAVRAGWVHA